jgi:hypothetical protein
MVTLVQVALFIDRPPVRGTGKSMKNNGALVPFAPFYNK